MTGLLLARKLICIGRKNLVDLVWRNAAHPPNSPNYLPNYLYSYVVREIEVFSHTSYIHVASYRYCIHIL